MFRFIGLTYWQPVGLSFLEVLTVRYGHDWQHALAVHAGDLRG